MHDSAVLDIESHKKQNPEYISDSNSDKRNLSIMEYVKDEMKLLKLKIKRLKTSGQTISLHDKKTYKELNSILKGMYFIIHCSDSNLLVYHVDG